VIRARSARNTNSATVSAVPLPHRSEQVAVVVQRQARVEAAVERDEVAAELDQLVDFGEHVLA
jgi:hypothetical protein